MKEIREIIQGIDRKIEVMKDEAKDLVGEVTTLLKKVKPEKDEVSINQPQPKRVWVSLKEVKGYPTFSIVWSQILYHHGKSGRLFTKDITRGNNYKILKSKFLGCLRGYPRHVQDTLWSYEERFGQIRKRMKHFSIAREHLLQCLKEKQQTHDSSRSEDHQSTAPAI